MNYYKNGNGQIFAFNPYQTVPVYLTPLTEAEVQEHLNGHPCTNNIPN